MALLTAPNAAVSCLEMKGVFGISWVMRVSISFPYFWTMAVHSALSAAMPLTPAVEKNLRY